MTSLSAKIHKTEPQGRHLSRYSGTQGANPRPVTDLAALSPETARLALKFLVPQPLLRDRARLERALSREVLNGGDLERVRVIRALLANIDTAGVEP